MEIVGVTADKRKLSGATRTVVAPTSMTATQEPPEGIVPWYEGIMQAAKDVKVNVDVGESGIYIVRARKVEGKSGYWPDRTIEEVRAAVEEGKTCLLVDDEGRVYTYCGEYTSSFDVSTDSPTFVGAVDYDYTKGVKRYVAQLNEYGNVTLSWHNPVKTPNPYKLTLTGAVEASYDGSKAVNINIPAGGGKGAYIINATHDAEGRLYADKTASEIRAAVAAGEMCLLYIDDGRVFSYFGEVFESLAGGITPTFAGTAFFDYTRRQMSFPLMHIKENKNVVGVNSNFPLPTGPAMYLTSNKYGYPIWEDINLLVKALPVPGDSTSTGYLRWNGSAWEAVTIAQLKADLGL